MERQLVMAEIVETNHRLSKGVQTLLGDPRKAIRNLATPVIVALFATFYNISDAR